MEGLPSYSFWGKQFIREHPSAGFILGKDMGAGKEGVLELEASWAAGVQAHSRNEVRAGSQRPSQDSLFALIMRFPLH